MNPFERPEIQELSGDDLISDGKTIDALKKPILPGTTYEVKLYHKQKRITILSKEDSVMLNHYETGQTIFRQNGLINYANYMQRLGFLQELEDCFSWIEDIIETYNKREDYEKSTYLTQELANLKEYIKNNPND